MVGRIAAFIRHNSEVLGRSLLALLVLVVLLAQVFADGVNVDATTVGLFAILLVLLVLPRIEEFNLGGFGARLRDRLIRVNESNLGPLGPDESDREPAATAALGFDDPAAAVAVLRGRLRDRLGYVSHVLLGQDCCQDPYSTIQLLLERRYIDEQRAGVLIDVLLASDALLLRGRLDSRQVERFRRAATELQTGLQVAVFREMVSQAIRAAYPAAGVQVNATQDAPDFRVDLGDRLLLIDAKLALRPDSPLVERAALRLRSLFDTERAGPVERLDALIVVPNASQSFESRRLGLVRVVTVDDLRSGTWE